MTIFDGLEKIIKSLSKAKKEKFAIALVNAAYSLLPDSELLIDTITPGTIKALKKHIKEKNALEALLEEARTKEERAADLLKKEREEAHIREKSNAAQIKELTRQIRNYERQVPQSVVVPREQKDRTARYHTLLGQIISEKLHLEGKSLRYKIVNLGTTLLRNPKTQECLEKIKQGKQTRYVIKDAAQLEVIIKEALEPKAIVKSTLPAEKTGRKPSYSSAVRKALAERFPTLTGKDLTYKVVYYVRILKKVPEVAAQLTAGNGNLLQIKDYDALYQAIKSGIDRPRLRKQKTAGPELQRPSLQETKSDVYDLRDIQLSTKLQFDALRSYLIDNKYSALLGDLVNSRMQGKNKTGYATDKALKFIDAVKENEARKCQH